MLDLEAEFSKFLEEDGKKSLQEHSDLLCPCRGLISASN